MTSEPATGEREVAADHLAAEEIINTIKWLGDGEKTAAIVKIPRLHSRKTRYDYEDLIQEAYSRILDGQRAWVRGVPAVPFFAGVMRSIAWEWKNELVSEEVDVGDEGALEPWSPGALEPWSAGRSPRSM